MSGTDRESSGRPLAAISLPTDAAVGYVPPWSAAVGALVAIGALLGIAMAAGAPVTALGAVLVGIVVALTVAAVDHTRILGSLVGGLGFLGAVCVAALLPVLGLRAGEPVTAGIGVAGLLVGFGVARFRVDAVGGGAIARAIAWLFRVVILTALLAVVVAMVGLDIGQLSTTVGGGGSLTGLLDPATVTTTVVGFLLLSWLAFASLWLFVASLPPATVLTERRRVQYQTVRSRTLTVAGVTLLGASSLFAVGYAVVEGVGGVAALAPVVGIVEAGLIRGALLRVCLLAGTLAFVVWIGRSTGAAVIYRRPAWLPSGIVVALGCLVAAFAGTAPALESVNSANVGGIQAVESAVSVIGTTAVGLSLAVCALLGLAVGLLAFPVLSGLGVLPTATAGPRLVLAGLLFAAGVHAVGGSAVVVAIGVVAAIIVWDITEYGIRQSRDIGVSPASRGGEIVHTGWSLSVGFLAVLITTAASLLLETSTVPQEQLLTILLLGTGVIVLLTVLLWKQ